MFLYCGSETPLIITKLLPSVTLIKKTAWLLANEGLN